MREFHLQLTIREAHVPTRKVKMHPVLQQVVPELRLGVRHETAMRRRVDDPGPEHQALERHHDLTRGFTASD
jgi:hypothetical protein